MRALLLCFAWATAGPSLQLVSAQSFEFGSKSCGACGASVSPDSQAGGTCPYCGARWATETSSYRTDVHVDPEPQPPEPLSAPDAEAPELRPNWSERTQEAIWVLAVLGFLGFGVGAIGYEEGRFALGIACLISLAIAIGLFFPEGRCWSSACTVNDVKSFESYVSDFPDGMHVAEAKTHLQVLRPIEAWSSACTTNTAQGFKDYLAAYPQSPHEEEARAQMARLESFEARLSREDSPDPAGGSQEASE